MTVRFKITDRMVEAGMSALVALRADHMDDQISEEQMAQLEESVRCVLRAAADVALSDT